MIEKIINDSNGNPLYSINVDLHNSNPHGTFITSTAIVTCTMYSNISFILKVQINSDEHTFNGTYHDAGEVFTVRFSTEVEVINNHCDITYGAETLPYSNIVINNVSYKSITENGKCDETLSFDIDAEPIDTDYPFNYELDKITEKETVYDFVERLKIGRDFLLSDFSNIENSIYKVNSSLLDLIKTTYISLPYTLAFNETQKVVCIKIPKDSLAASTMIDLENYETYEVLIAYLDKLRVDISSAISLRSVENQLYIVAKFDTKYPKEDMITVYLKK